MPSSHDIIMEAGIVFYSAPQWTTVNGQTVGGLAVYSSVWTSDYLLRGSIIKQDSSLRTTLPGK